MPKPRTTVTSELAATTSEPICPMITEYMENARPQITSLPIAGRDRRTKSCISSLFFLSMYRKFSLISFWKAETTKQPINSMTRESMVASATPATPIFGAPKRPKMNTALRMIFSANAMILRNMLTRTRPMLRSTDR